MKRHERLSLGNQSQRSGRHLEEPSEPEEGRERWQGVTADPAKRDSVWSKASKSRDVDRGHLDLSEVSVTCLNGKGATPPDEGGWLGRGDKPLNGKVSWTRLWDEISPRALAMRSKPSRGCDHLGRELAGMWEPPVQVDAPEVS